MDTPLQRFGNFGAEVPEIRRAGFNLLEPPRASGIQVRLTALHPPPDLAEIDAVVIRVAQSLAVMKEGTREKRHLSLQQLVAPIGQQHQKRIGGAPMPRRPNWRKLIFQSRAHLESRPPHNRHRVRRKVSLITRLLHSHKLSPCPLAFLQVLNRLLYGRSDLPQQLGCLLMWSCRVVLTLPESFGGHRQRVEQFLAESPDARLVGGP
jgi:hypothetical protein